MLWTLCGIVFAGCMLVYAYYEASKAAYYRARTREIEFHREWFDRDANPTAAAHTLPAQRFRREWAENVFDESTPSEQIFNTGEGGTKPEEEGTSLPQQVHKPELQPVELDDNAITFLNVLSPMVSKEGSPTLEEELLPKQERAAEPKQIESPALKQTQIQAVMSIPMTMGDKPPQFSEVSLLLYQKNPKPGVYYISGQIVEVFDTELCKISDGTGLKIISHKSLMYCGLNDVVMCQIEIKKKSWECLKVWRMDVSKLKHVM